MYYSSLFKQVEVILIYYSSLLRRGDNFAYHTIISIGTKRSIYKIEIVISIGEANIADFIIDNPFSSQKKIPVHEETQQFM